MLEIPGPASSRFYRIALAAGDPISRGLILSTNEPRVYTRTELAGLFQQLGLPIVPSYDVTVTKVVYETVDPWGVRTRASGAVVLPRGALTALPIVSYQHGTILRRDQVPSARSEEVNLGLAMATTGYVVAMPDYLGLGESPGFHPYHHAKSEATAAVDLLRATRVLALARSVSLSGRLFLAGYSQGGHATAALQRELELHHTAEFSVTASAPMAGAYDLSGVTTEDFLSDRSMPNPYYFAYVLKSYHEVYGLSSSLADLLVEPYASELPPLLDGLHDAWEVNQAMPTKPALVLKPEYLAAFRSDLNHPLRAALRENDVYDWTPRAPTRLYHCRGDQDVLYQNTEVALSSFIERGASNVQWIDPAPAATHGVCAPFALFQAKFWFDSLKN